MERFMETIRTIRFNSLSSVCVLSSVHMHARTGGSIKLDANRQ